MTVMDLKAQGEAARVLAENLKAIGADDDEALVSDTIEGETDLFEAIDGALARLQELDAHADAIKARIDELKDRKDRFGRQSEMIRSALATAIGMAGLKKVERPTATISMRAVAPSVLVTDEADIPSMFWKPQPPKLDKKAVLDALKDKQDVPGATLSNGGQTISIRGR